MSEQFRLDLRSTVRVVTPSPAIGTSVVAHKDRSAAVAGATDNQSFGFLIEQAIRAEGGTGWCIEPDPAAETVWLRVTYESSAIPRQGWKLHVSASTAVADAVLAAVLPVLLAERAQFKVAATVDRLQSLNEGNGGLSQIGKFVTIYPGDDAQAVRLAVALDRATRGLRGPAIPSDRPLVPGSLVHYRYGGFDGRHVQTALGEIAPAINRPDGTLVPDRRLQRYSAPEWAPDPFVAAGAAPELAPASPLVAGRYLIVSTLSSSARGSVHLAVDINGPRPCILKRARHDTLLAADGRDARDRLCHEAAILEQLAADPRFPTVYALVEHEGDHVLVLEDMGGETLEMRMRALAPQGCQLPNEQIVAWGRELASLLHTLHTRGTIYRDLKSANIMILPSGAVGLVDFDISHDLASPGGPFGRGTRGYMSPQQEAGAAPSAVDDVYSLGAVLYFMATGAEPSQAPHPRQLLDRPLSRLNPTVHPALEPIIARCLDHDPSRRFLSMPAVDAALAAVPFDEPPMPVRSGADTARLGGNERERARDLARQLGDTLCAVARPAPSGAGVAWFSTHDPHVGMQSCDINHGNSGPVLALAEIVAEFADPAHKATLARGTRWLLGAPALPGTPAGLYVGAAGPVLALLRAGQVLHDAELIAEAERRGRALVALPHRSPDVFNGTAGRVRAHLLLWDETHAPAQLDAARIGGDVLLAAAAPAGDDGLCWTIPPGYDGLSGQTNLGYAHGAAGIADVLLDLYDVTGEVRYLRGAQGAARWLRRLAVPTLADGRGRNWPVNEGEEPSATFWCHGATGVGRFLLHAAVLDLIPEAAELTAGAARAVACAARWANPTQCHGLSGNIEFLLDMFQVTGDQAYLNEAQSLMRLMEAWATERDGWLVWPSETPGVISPDYMIGYAGVAVCLLRLADPARRPHQLSRAGFRYAPSAGAT